MKPTLPVLVVCLSVLMAVELSATEAVDFSRDILPVLSENCFQCHGPDETNRESGLRLDQRDSAFAELDSGGQAIVAGHSDQSELFRRIVSSDRDLLMPPPESGKKLSQPEIATIKRGSTRARRGETLVVSNATEAIFAAPCRGLAGQRSDRSIHPAPACSKPSLTPELPADKETLIRRVTLDLTGLPPTIKEIDDFLADDSPLAFERVVDRLLDSAAYGEHMARIWLDAARYADTHGLHLDNERSIWPYRDWVIDAFNRNMPFDQFTIEQLAGDLLAEPTLQQRVATGFNRCNVTTSEGGSIDDEYYVRYAVDRVETTATVWLGLTAGCAACHDHKFDPLTQKEFYQLFSYFFSLTERAMDGNALLPPPSVKVPTAEQVTIEDRLSVRNSLPIDEQIEIAVCRSCTMSIRWPNEQLGELEQADYVWFDDAVARAVPSRRVMARSLEVRYRARASGFQRRELIGPHRQRADATLLQCCQSALTIGAPARLFAYVYLDPENPPETVQLQFNDGSWEHRAYWGADKVSRGRTARGRQSRDGRSARDRQVGATGSRRAAAVGLKPEVETERLGLHAVRRHGALGPSGCRVDRSAARPHNSPPSPLGAVSANRSNHRRLPAEIQKILDVEPEKRSAEQVKQLTRYYLQHVHPAIRPAIRRAAQAAGRVEEQSWRNLEKAIPATLVMEDRKEPRQAHVLERGEYTVKREPVSSRCSRVDCPAARGRSGQSARIGPVAGRAPLTR